MNLPLQIFDKIQMIMIMMKNARLKQSHANDGVSRLNDRYWANLQYFW